MEISELPEEMLDHIVSFASLEALKNLSRTNKNMFHLTKRYISEKCVINPNRREREKHLLDWKDLQRVYFNMKLKLELRDPLISPLNTSKVVPRNVYLLKVTASTRAFVNDNKNVEKAFLHYDVDLPMSDEEKTAIKPNFSRGVDWQIFSIKVRRINQVGRLISSIQWFKNLTNLEIKVENFYWDDKQIIVGENEKPSQLRKIVLVKVCSEKFIQYLIDTSPNLTSLNLEDCKIDNLTVRSNLKELFISSDKKVNFENLISKNLESLTLKKVLLYKENLSFLCENTRLSRLVLQNCDIEGSCDQKDLSFVKDIPNVKLEGGALKHVWSHLKNVEVLELEPTQYIELEQMELPRLKYLIVSSENAEKSCLKHLVAPNLELCSVSGFIDWLPQCKAVILEDDINNENLNLQQFIDVLENQELVIPKIFFKCLEINIDILNVFLNCKLRNIELLIDFSPYFQYNAQEFEDVLTLVKTVENLNLKVANDGESFLITKENNLRIEFFKKPVDLKNARGIFARWLY